jgi:hypothetical protein
VAGVGELDYAASATLPGNLETVFEPPDFADHSDLTDQAKTF